MVLLFGTGIVIMLECGGSGIKGGQMSFNRLVSGDCVGESCGSALG